MNILAFIREACPKIKLGLTTQLVGIAFSCLCALTSGCATGYLADRGRDGADIFTASVGVGGGAKARVGPVRVGAFFAKEKAGFRGGDFLKNGEMKGIPFDWFPGTVDIDATISSVEAFRPLPDTLAASRGKQYFAQGLLGLSLSSWPAIMDDPEKNYAWTAKTWQQHLPYYTQIEVAVGLGGTLRMGFNPGELVDFILGWFGIDIFGDDLYAKKQKGESNQVPEDTVRKLADPQH